MEGVSMKYYKKEEDDLVPVPDQELTLISEFYSYLSGDSDQNAATTTTHLDNTLVELVRRKDNFPESKHHLERNRWMNQAIQMCNIMLPAFTYFNEI
eukprot:1315720-Ditylum_brightwellii.AAC.1